ncbi:hypothetical protein CS369_13220 [Candidatus Symbiopectobacterium sp. 'North America']|nr:hypothetical protein [Candidatus Symbiopectobacterium sp. 'North America']
MADFSDSSTLATATSFRCAKPAGTHPDAVKSAVIAPDGQVYLTDGHHSVSALHASTPDSDIMLSLRITDDLRNLPSMAVFWDYMQQHIWCGWRGLRARLHRGNCPLKWVSTPCRTILIARCSISYGVLPMNGRNRLPRF